MIPAISDIGGVPTLVVDGEPFVILGAQCDIWRSTRQDEKVVEFIDAYREMNATAISFGIPWAKMEPERDLYDFSFLDWFIERTEAAGLKLVVNLFNSNVCGKCEELTEGERYPQYTPDYIKNDPEGFTRIVPNVDIEYHPGGPPLCPNDPATLDRETRYLRRVAMHLKETDRNCTVIMVQLNNEYFYQQWADCKDNTQKHVRCVCEFCTAKYDAGRYLTAEEFMFTSFAEYNRTLTDTFKAVYPLPIYVNSPWWAPYIIDIFLRVCPNLDFVGIDGVYSVVEPNQLTVGQRGRNLPFAAESPTEAPSTKPYLPMLPYYTALKMNGLGNLLWEAPDPDTVVNDRAAFVRFKRALYPIKNAMIPLVEARNRKRLTVWYSQSANVEMKMEIDIFGNRIDLQNPVSYSGKGTVLIEGRTVRTVRDGPFDLRVGEVKLNVAGSQAGFVIPFKDGLIVGTGGASIGIEGIRSVVVDVGRFEGRRWVSEGRLSLERGRLRVAPGLVRIRPGQEEG
ncbi:MAG: beta-galactosidase [Chloroflexota bacterium]|nr:beta-galactosidase [Chloroflexota bacterium]